MVKILVADLFGTLIPETIIKGDYLYGKGSDKKIDKICNDCMIMNQHRMLESFPNYSDIKLEGSLK